VRWPSARNSPESGAGDPNLQNADFVSLLPSKVSHLDSVQNIHSRAVTVVSSRPSTTRAVRSSCPGCSSARCVMTVRRSIGSAVHSGYHASGWTKSSG
jgi:hypothetical protein